MQKLIGQKRSIIVACDVSGMEELRNLVFQTRDVEGIGSYKVGAILGLSHGLGRVVACIKELTDKPIIYDHQKAGSDIPALGVKFVETVKKSGTDALILFPLSGPAVEESWVKACQNTGLRVIVGGHMTHSEFLHRGGGYVSDDAPMRIYKYAARLGVTDFVLPGNAWPELVFSYRMNIAEHGKSDNAVFYMPGFGAQGGALEKMAGLMKNGFHAILGRSIYEAQDIRQAAQKAVAGLLMPVTKS